ncbi:MAG TPA: phospholipase D-like domain-containing protein [Tepidisphaeraceae bacterium]|nr:phospholipase D-like domain-containing protein [Tepidisphaeraceae bacterium]
MLPARGRGNTRGGTPGTDWRHTLLAAGAGAAAALFATAVARQFKTPNKSIRRPLHPVYAVTEEQFVRTMGGLLRPPVVRGNRVTTLYNGEQIFPAMLEAVRSAESTLTMETFIYWSGRTGRAFAEAIADRARAGVRCHLLLDWLGSNRLDQESLGLMTDAGVQCERYHRHWWRVGRLNHRTHRKLLVIDGRVGFTGGVGIADEWNGHAQDPCHWRDNHYKIEGPVVAQLQSAFTDNWLKARHAVLHDAGYFPALTPAGDLRCQAFQSSPDEGSESMRLMYQLAITAARKSVRIATAYFVPDALSTQSLIDARRRGVAVEVMLPGRHIDTQLVRHASRERWGPLLDAGVRVFEYQPTMFHAKCMVVDGAWTSIGSTNFDNRSFRLNDEANVNVFDNRFAAEQEAWYERDKARCRELTFADWHGRSAVRKTLDKAADVIGSQL